jgi:hypothetical protein
MRGTQYQSANPIGRLVSSSFILHLKVYMRSFPHLDVNKLPGILIRFEFQFTLLV